MKIKSIGNVYRAKLATVLEEAHGIITPTIVSEALRLSSQESGRLLSRWNQHGWVKRIKHGVYIPIPVDDLTGDSCIEDPWILADRLYAPGYMGGFTAVKHWDFSEQLFDKTTFYTTKKINDKYPAFGSSHFQIKNISTYKLFGTQIVWRDNVKVLVSDPSKTIVDLLDDPRIAGGMRVVQDIFLMYKESMYFNMEIIMEYSEKMKNRTIVKRLGFLMESLGMGKLVEQYSLQNKISAGYSLFDPSINNPSVVRKWNLKVPASWKNNRK